MRKGEKKFNAEYNPPKKKFKIDIEDLIYNNGNLWVKTSTKDDKKGILYDLYDSEARFLDSFFINTKGRVIRINQGHIYISETDDEDLPYIVKYKIEN